jgi:hypothetical protein
MPPAAMPEQSTTSFPACNISVPPSTVGSAFCCFEGLLKLCEFLALNARILIVVQSQRFQGCAARNALVDSGFRISVKGWPHQCWKGAIHAAGDHMIPAFAVHDDELCVKESAFSVRGDIEQTRVRESRKARSMGSR